MPAACRKVKLHWRKSRWPNKPSNHTTARASWYTGLVLKNLTITVDEAVLQWAKHEAVNKGTSTSKLVGDILAEEMRRTSAYWKAYEEWKKIEPVPMAGPVKFNREEEHERRHGR